MSLPCKITGLLLWSCRSSFYALSWTYNTFN